MRIKLFKNLRTKFRKHKFDFKKSRRVHSGVFYTEGVIPNELIYTAYRCTKCGKELILDKEQILKLPKDLKRGCPGYGADYKHLIGV